MCEKKEGRVLAIYLALALLFLSFIFSLSSISAETYTSGFSGTGGSFSEVNTNYFSSYSSSLSSFGGFGSYLSGPQYRATDNSGFFDMEVFIPPLGCQPYVVRSDLLEEQNVPVFCKLTPLKINPGIDITRIENIAVTQKTSNPYVAGVGFYPARAALGSSSKFVNNPTSDNIGYVVVVLKRQATENQMPDNVTVTLSAQLRYGANYAFGIGENEFYLPVMSDSDFANNYKGYSFFDGVGYLRAESINTNSAVIAVYTSDQIKAFSDSIEKGKTSKDIYLPTGTGGQGMRINLKEITVPETKAKIKVNGKYYEVYNGNSFADGKCRISSIASYGAGTGYVSFYCGSEKFTLTKNFGKVKLSFASTSGETNKEYNIGEEILDVSSDFGKHLYPVYIGSISSVGSATEKNSYAVIASSDSILTNDQITNLRVEVSNLVSRISKDSSLGSIVEQISKQSLSGAKLYGVLSGNKIVISSNDIKKTLDITYIGQENNDIKITPSSAEEYYLKAKKYYEYVKSTYSGEINNINNQMDMPWVSTDQQFGADSLWEQYNLASTFNQKQEAKSLLSRIVNDYPTASNKISSTNVKTAQELLNTDDLLSTEGSTDYSKTQDLSFQLVGVERPSEDEASVKIDYTDAKQRLTKVLRKGDVWEIGDERKTKVTLNDFSQTQATVSYKCERKDVSGKTASSPSGQKTLNEKQVMALENCDSQVQISKINLQQVAHVTLTPMVDGRSRETNFTFSIGIEKRADLFKTTPEEANKQIEELNDLINEFKNITDSLGTVIKAGKAACLATSAVINLKNLVSGTEGEATARKQVMTGVWNDICATEVANKKYSSEEECISAKTSDKTIPNEIDAAQKIMSDFNTLDEKSMKEAKDKNGIISNDRAKEAELKPLIEFVKTKNIQVKDEAGNTKDNSYINTQLGKTAEFSYSEVAQVNYNLRMIAVASDKSKEAYQKAAYSILKAVEDRWNSQHASSAEMTSAGLEASDVDGAITNRNTAEISYDGRTFDQLSKSIQNQLADQYIDSKSKVSVKKGTDGNWYLYTLSNNLQLSNIYDIKNDELLKSPNGVDKLKGTSREYLTNVIFKEYDSKSYKNACKNCNFMKTFVTEPYKGMPALLPFDDVNGWYVQVKQVYPTLGEQKSYQDSGRLNSFYLCNVGKDGMMDGQEKDSDCRRFDFYTGDSLDSFNGLSKEKTREVVTQAITAIRSAQEQLKKNPSEITIRGITKNNGKLKVIGYSGNDSEGKCTDFMSAGDCQTIFNVCDPFVCPNSRCDFGGEYKVDNVIQSGLVGSTLLCLPNFIGFNKETGVVVPVCLTGINAGLQGLTAIFESYRDCLNESVKTNRTVGMCDMIQSVYLCDFVWRQIGPFVEAMSKNLFLGLFGKGDRGGAEYAFTADAWSNAEKSMNYFQTTYAKSSKLSFGVTSLADAVVSDVCKMSASATYPNGFDAMLEPESPIQFTASFEEIPFTDATVPATSQYKVFYHIYAGEDYGHYYTVYLKSAPTSLGYAGKDRTVVATGYVPKGGRATDTVDYVDVSGFKELCVRIDAQDKCGFKSVSTSAILNYAKDKAVQSQATTSVTTEKECVAGSASIGAYLTPNLQQGVSEMVNPELYNQGVIRVCASANPGETTEPSRWLKVGYCDNAAMGCWLDTKSVEKAIQGKGIENATLDAAKKLSEKDLIENYGYYGSEIGAEEIKKLKTVYSYLIDNVDDNTKDSFESITYPTSLKNSAGIDYEDRTLESMDSDFDALEKKLIVSNQKAQLAFLRAELYAKLARALMTTEKQVSDVKTVTPNSNAVGSSTNIKPTNGYSFDSNDWIRSSDNSITNFYRSSSNSGGIDAQYVFFCKSFELNLLVSRVCLNNIRLFNVENGKITLISGLNLDSINSILKTTEDKKVYKDLNEATIDYQGNITPKGSS